jgi:hypothetical protein
MIVDAQPSSEYSWPLLFETLATDPAGVGLLTETLGIGRVPQVRLSVPGPNKTGAAHQSFSLSIG